MLFSMSAALANKTAYAITTSESGNTINGIRHFMRSDKKPEVTDDIAPTQYGGMVRSWAVEEVKPVQKSALVMIWYGRSVANPCPR